jgi:hypothetical protein
MGSTTAQYAVNGRLVRSRKITSAMTNATTAVIDIPAGTFIPPNGVSIYISTLFAGGTPSFTIGDSDVDGWATSTGITEATAGTYTHPAAALSKTGKVYASADTIDLVMSASATAGVAYVFAVMYDISDIIDD